MTPHHREKYRVSRRADTDVEAGVFSGGFGGPLLLLLLLEVAVRSHEEAVALPQVARAYVRIDHLDCVGRREPAPHAVTDALALVPTCRESEESRRFTSCLDAATEKNKILTSLLVEYTGHSTF